MLIRSIVFVIVLVSAHVQAEMPQPIKDPDALIGNEIARLDTLIEATTTSLEGQKQLRLQIMEYQKYQDNYLKKTQDNDLLFKLVKSAYRTLQMIKEQHLLHAFDSEFIDELTVLSQPATKRGVPRS